MRKYLIEYNRDAKHSNSFNLVGGNINNFQIRSYDQLKDLEFSDYIGENNNSNFKNSEVISIGNFKAKITDDMVTLYQKSKSGQGKYSEFKIKDYGITFGYLIEMDRFLKNFLSNNSIEQNSKGYSLLILGFGLGGASLNFSKFNNIVKIDSIELEPSLYKLFKRVTISKNIPVPNKLNFIEGDAIEYLKHCKRNGKKYDLILDDLFHNYQKVNYDLSLIHDCLNKNGLFFSNVHNNPLNYINNLKNKNFRDIKIYTNSEHLIIGKK